MKSQISTKSLKALRRALPVGGVNTIAERLKISQSTVSKALSGSGKTVNMKIVDTALTVVEESRSQAKELENRINKLA